MAIIGGLVLASCGGDDQASDEPALGEVLDRPTASELTLPYDAFAPLPSEVMVLETAEDLLLSDCMGGQGFPWEGGSRTVDDATRHARRYFLMDASQAATYGYQPPPNASSQALLELQQQDAAAATPEAAAAFEACLGDARSQLASTVVVQEDIQLADGLSGDSWERSFADSRVQDAFDEWSACMDEAGFDYDDPRQANGDPAWAEGQPADGVETSEVAPVSDEQRAVASADVACKDEVNLVGTWLAVETAYQTRALEENSEALTDARQRLDGALAHATDVVEAGGAAAG